MLILKQKRTLFGMRIKSERSVPIDFSAQNGSSNVGGGRYVQILSSLGGLDACMVNLYGIS